MSVGKGGKDRVVMLPHTMHAALKAQMALARAIGEHDRQQHQPGVEVPDALATHLLQAGFTRMCSKWRQAERPRHWIRFCQSSDRYRETVRSSGICHEQPIEK